MTQHIINNDSFETFEGDKVFCLFYFLETINETYFSISK
jgi:hypothetical protein